MRGIGTLGLLFLTMLAVVFGGCAYPKPIDYKIAHQYSVADPQFGVTVSNLLGPPLIGGNSVKTLRNGDEIFPEMLAAIRSARRNINLETYTYLKSDIANQFTDALCERARAGVKVNVVIDWMGGFDLDKSYINRMRDAGVTVHSFHQLKPYDPFFYKKVDHRTHRKLLIIDGKIGFTGGVGIANEWTGHAQDPAHWRDNHYRVEGPVVAQLQAAFCDNWMRSTGQVLDGSDYFPPLENTGKLSAQVFKSSYVGGTDSMELLMLISIAAAEKNIRMESAYFVPDKLTRTALINAAHRGVKVQIIVPGSHIDVPVVRSASRANWGELIAAGVEIREYQPTMIHAKLLIVDDRWTSVGSSNLDNRSFRLNAEANLDVLDRGFAQEQTAIFEDDLSHTHLITSDEWKRRPVQIHLLDDILSLFGPEF